MQRRPLVFLNHSLVSIEQAQISVEDNGFLLGDGVFETCGLFRGVAFLLEDHLERLRAGLQFVEIPQPESLSLLPQIIEDLVQRNGLSDCTARLRITISRGSGAEPTFLVTAMAWECPPLLREAISVAVDFAEHPVQASPWNQVKSISRQRSVLTGRHRRPDCYDSIQWNTSGLLTEGTYTNLFVVDAVGSLRTPTIAAGCLAGVTRGVVLQVAHQLGIEAREDDPRPGDLLQAAEAFLTSSLSGVLPIHRVHVADSRPGEWVEPAVGQAAVEYVAPGPITAQIQIAYQARLEEATCRPK